jgi:enamine deaminase RidA (YjgF/YER057c/UK114 family)
MSSTEKIPGPLGKYSQVRVVPMGTSTMLYLSGTAIIGEAPFDVVKQAEMIFRRMGQLLAEHGANLDDLVKITAFLADIRSDYQAYNAVRNRVFADHPNPPASSAVGVTLNLNAELRIEIEGVAVVHAKS